MYTHGLWRGRLLASGVVIGLVLLFVGMLILLPQHRNPEQILGIPLPPSVDNLNVERHHRFLGEYNAYLCFDIAPHDVNAMLADPAFGPRTMSTDPMEGIGTAARGQTSLATIVQQAQPAWWNPPPGRLYLLAYRSQLGANVIHTGPDSAWYVIDTSDPARATVYVYVVEV